MKAALRVLGAVLTIVVTGVLLTIGVVWVYSRFWLRANPLLPMSNSPKPQVLG